MQPPSYPPQAPPPPPQQPPQPPPYPPGPPRPSQPSAQGYPAYGPAPQPPKRGLSAGCIVGIVACALGALVAIPLAVGAAVVFREARDRDRAAKAAAARASDPAAAHLPQSYTTPNGLLTAHYPADFAAKTLDDSTLLVSRNLTGGLDELVTLGAVNQPITNDVHEFARLLLGAVRKNVEAKGGTYTIGKERAGKCFRGHDGLEIESSFHLGLGGDYVAKTCFFLDGDRGFELRYDVPRARPEEIPLLESVIAATDIKP